jgi:NAD(P)-dependent dehydrogenase (short-subunit alcohol dehydrogenase family)
MNTAIVTGSASGLGREVVAALLSVGWAVYGIDKDAQEASEGFIPLECDIQWRGDIDSVIGNIDEPIDVLINCAGVNHITPFEQLEGKDWERLMDINAKAIFNLTQAALPLLARSGGRPEGGTVLNIVSNAAHVPMTHSLAYNASKAAALMITFQMARELFKTHGLTIFSISPNKLAGTQMSRYIEGAVPAMRGWTPEEAEAYQRNSLPIGQETDPAVLAEFIGFLLSTKERHRYLHGCNLPYGA